MSIEVDLEIYNAAQELTDEALTICARGGNSEAFGELVRRHRAQAYGVASGISQDPHLAEDIVQDALIRAFLKLGTLLDASSFIPWFHRIVRNQANSRMRRGGPHAKEKPLTHLISKGAGDENMQWDHFDNLFEFIQARNGAKAQDDHYDINPVDQFIHKETLGQLLSLISAMQPRERAMMEAYFYQELTPNEIAALFNASSASVYKTISRGKQKLQKETIRLTINEYVRERRSEGKPISKVIDNKTILI
ncbi:RNA polymerase sigma factor [Paenibacillus psychroresistens]|uniref:RNA polymerase sigma factor n=1 Tax=Paenibacillus psychroresistens TaxID=1778678 RepID=UPI00139162EB|nr:sigma-70 family RNA polymerase sigma factor [Paenibacillus psychroresistens]